MTRDTKHTPLPWRLEPNGPCFNIKSPDRVEHFAILVGMGHNNPGEFKANANLIVRAVNAHDDLVAALSDLKCHVAGLGDPMGDDGPLLEAADAALAKAWKGPA